ncbi:MAG: hypothetical protein ACRD4T_00135 [Candidatus Acidiferrales bacterium]
MRRAVAILLLVPVAALSAPAWPWTQGSGWSANYGTSGQCFVSNGDGIPSWQDCPGGGAPTDATYWTGSAHGSLSAEHNLGALGTGLVLNTSGTPSAYAGTSCTNQFPRSLSASGAATCASVSLTADVTGTLGAGNGGTGVTSTTDDSVLLANGSAWESKALPDCDGDATVLHYDTGTNAFSCGDDDTGAGSFPTVTLASPVTCAVSASYCTIFSYTPGASKNIALRAFILVDSDSTTVAPQFRVSSADTGYVGNCLWTANAGAFDLIAIGTGPADTADTSWTTAAPQPVRVECALTSDASPGAILIEWQLETGTSPTQTVLAGSYYTAVNN